MQTVNTRRFIRKFNLSDCLHILIRKLWLLILAAVLAAGALWGLHRLFTKPQYRSTAVLYVLGQQGQRFDAASAENFTLGLDALEDCRYLLQSHAVLDRVIDDLQLPEDYGQLVKSISVGAPENTRVLEVSALADSPEQAQNIVNAICDIGAEKTADTMGAVQIHIYDYGSYSAVPANRLRKSTYLLFGCSAALLLYWILLAAGYDDDRIRSDEDIRRYLEITVLGDIPEASGSRGGRYGYGSGKYGYGYKKKK